jgi:hypothetical protein
MSGFFVNMVLPPGGTYGGVTGGFIGGITGAE